MTAAADRHVDLVVLGCGPAGERAAIVAARAGRSVVVVERANVIGGTRVNWGTIPSKTLRESALFVDSLTRHRLHGIHCQVAEEITVGDFMYRERVVVQQELDLINATLGKHRVDVLRGHGRFLDTHRVEVCDDDGTVSTVISTDVIVVAVGSTPNHPRDILFDGELVFDSESILAMPRLPASMVVLGAGVIGIEYASIFAALGLEVTLVDTREQLLPYLDREIAAILAKGLASLGITVIPNDRYERVERLGGRVRCATRRGAVLDADVLLYCVGRDGNTGDLCLDRAGLSATAYGLIEVNEHYQTAVPHIYAVGDVIGFPALASTSMEQGRRAVRHAFDLPVPAQLSGFLPFAIYAIPEVSYVGETEEQLRERGASYVVGRGRYALNPRGQILGATEGLLKLICEAGSGKVLAVHIVGHSASELVHVGVACLAAGATCQQIAGSIFNYPTLADLYRHAALEACAAAAASSGSA
jgi:NAD(P) transhydrogenase